MSWPVLQNWMLCTLIDRRHIFMCTKLFQSNVYLNIDSIDVFKRWNPVHDTRKLSSQFLFREVFNFFTVVYF